MDFSFDEDHAAVGELAKQIISERSGHERLKELENKDTPDGLFDRDLYSELAKAGLLGIHLDAACGGEGLDFLAACLVFDAVGASAAYVPVLESMIAGGMALETFGSTVQKETWLPQIIDGSKVFTAALYESRGEVVIPVSGAGSYGAPRDGKNYPVLLHPNTKALEVDNGWKLSGESVCVPAGLSADVVLVPAAIGDKVGIFIVPMDAKGIKRTRQDGPAHPLCLISYDDVQLGSDAILGTKDQGAEIAVFLADRMAAALCVIAAAATQSAVKLTSDYTKSREQFDKPIATFQAVGQRAADAYVDQEGIRLTAWQAAWRISVGLEASEQIAIAKFWAADAGQRAVHAAMHLHGGVGVDRDYPLHRYFLLLRQIEMSLGGAQVSLQRLGQHLASI